MAAYPSSSVASSTQTARQGPNVCNAEGNWVKCEGALPGPCWLEQGGPPICYAYAEDGHCPQLVTTVLQDCRGDDAQCPLGLVYNNANRRCEKDCPSGQYYSARFDVCVPKGRRAGARTGAGYRNSFCCNDFDCALTEHRCYPLFRFDEARCMDASRAPGGLPRDGGNADSRRNCGPPGLPEA